MEIDLFEVFIFGLVGLFPGSGLDLSTFDMLHYFYDVVHGSIGLRLIFMDEFRNFSSMVFIWPSMNSWVSFIWWYILVYNYE